MRDVDSPIVCSGNWGYLRRRMSVRRDSRLSKFRAGYKQSDPYLDDFILEREDVFDFMCGMPPSMQ